MVSWADITWAMPCSTAEARRSMADRERHVYLRLSIALQA